MFRELGVLSLGLGLAACGARSALLDSDSPTSAQSSSGSGGAGGSGGASVSSSSSGGSLPFACDALVLVEPVVVAPLPGYTRAPEIGLLPSGEVFVAHIGAGVDLPGAFAAGILSPFTVWPPVLTDFVAFDIDVLDQVTGDGPDGPVALIRYGDGSSLLATKLFPQLEGVSMLGGGTATMLFAAAIPDRYLAAQSTEAPTYNVLGVGSYQPSSLPQSEEPLICITSRMGGAGVPSGTGFLAAFFEPDPPDPSCGPEPPQGTTLSLMRYEAPPEPGSFLVRTQGERFAFGDPMAHVQLVPTSYGAWVVLQNEGSPSPPPPAILAARIDAKAQLLVPGEAPIAVSPEGVTVGPVAAAALGDGLAVAWLEEFNPPAAIVVQIVRPDGSLGASLSFPTNVAGFQGRRLRMRASADARSLLLAWDGPAAEQQIGLARIDCLTGL